MIDQHNSATVAATSIGLKGRLGALDNMVTALTMVLGALLMIIGSKLHIPVKPVPFTGQTMSVLLIALTMSPVRAFGSVFLWISLGAVGLPVFASHVVSSSALVGPTAGYIFGMLVAATLGAWLNQTVIKGVQEWMGKQWGVSEQRAQWLGCVSIGLIADIVTLTFGWAYLSTFLGAHQAWLLGVKPYLVWDLVKILTTTVIVSSYGLRHKLASK